MSKVKITELRNAIKENEKDNIKVVEFNGIEVKVVQSLPITDKLSLARSICESAVSRVGGLHLVSKSYLDIATKVLVAESYTNLTLPQVRDEDGTLITNTIETYDMLVSSGLFELIYSNIPEREVYAIEKVISNEIELEEEKHRQENSISFVIKGLLTSLIDSIPSLEGMDELAKSADDTISQFDPTKLKYVADFMKAAQGEVNDEG